jgi:MFS family permease
LQAWGALAILVTLSICSFLDRGIISLMVDPMKRDLGLSDAQMGLLQGTAFGLLYATLGVPMGWLIDRTSRRHVVFAGVTIWSLCAVMSGLARNFTQLFAARVGLGAGEAALSPAAYSIIADLFPRRRLAIAASIYGMGATVGSALALFLGAYLVHLASVTGPWNAPFVGALHDWQIVFVWTGLPGLALAWLIFLVPEMRTRPASGAPGTALLPFLASRRTYLTCHFLGWGTLLMMAYALMAWLPSLVLRKFGIPITELGMYLGIIHIVAGLAGHSLAGTFADRWFRKGRTDAYLRYPMVAVLIGGASVVLTATSDSMTVVLLGASFAVMMSACGGLSGAHLQITVPPALRGRVTALYLLVSNCVALLVGPASVGLITDQIFGNPEMVGYSLALAFGILGPLSAVIFALGLGPARRAVAQAAGLPLEPAPGTQNTALAR